MFIASIIDHREIFPVPPSSHGGRPALDSAGESLSAKAAMNVRGQFRWCLCVIFTQKNPPTGSNFRTFPGSLEAPIQRLPLSLSLSWFIVIAYLRNSIIGLSSKYCVKQLSLNPADQALD